MGKNLKVEHIGTSGDPPPLRHLLPPKIISTRYRNGKEILAI
jgi:hypothetical protein